MNQDEVVFNILIIDDDPLSRKIIKAFLSHPTHNIDEVSNGEDGLKIIELKEFSLILLDLQLPNISGIEVVKKIRHFEGKKNKHTNIALMTATLRNEVKEDIANLDIQYLLQKPIKKELLLSIIKKSTSSI